jgi:hypothetical protein
MPTTKYARFQRWQALVLLCVTAVAIVWCVYAALNPIPTTEKYYGALDLGLYRRIAQRVHEGESYYQAAGEELRPAGYPTGSVFNWRTPTYAWFFGLLPNVRWAQAILVFLCVGIILAAFTALERAGSRRRAVLGILAMLGVLVWSIDGEAYLAQELWAGVLVTLSICGYLLGSWQLGAVAGLAALFFRELALPYCLIAAGFASRKPQRRELMVWIAGLAAYAFFLAWHVHEVIQHIRPEDRQPATWLRFGGLDFILATNHMNSFLFSAPVWVGAVYLPLALLGLGAWTGESSWRMMLSAGVYLTAFAIVGQPFNDYWGLMYVGVLPFGIAWAPAALVDLCRAATGRPPAHGPASSLQ